jgi:MFS family permease
LQSFPASEKPSQKKVEIGDIEDVRRDAAPPSTAVDALETWHSPRINMFRVFATFWSFFVLGMNDGSYGVRFYPALNIFRKLTCRGFGSTCMKYLISPERSDASQLEAYYDLNYTVISLIFLSPFAGYTLAAAANNLVHVKFGQRGVAIVGPACHLVSYIAFSVHPPYPVLVIMFIVVGFGNGLIDAAWCAWIGNMANSNEVSGFLQASYALGATVAPLIATALISKAGLGWYAFYYIMVGHILYTEDKN